MIEDNNVCLLNITNGIRIEISKAFWKMQSALQMQTIFTHSQGYKCSAGFNFKVLFSNVLGPSFGIVLSS